LIEDLWAVCGAADATMGQRPATTAKMFVGTRITKDTYIATHMMPTAMMKKKKQT
jgi:hypothetical protein